MTIAQLEKEYQLTYPKRKLIFTYRGIGITSKQEITVSVHLAEPGSGIQFILPDSRGNSGASIRIPALAQNVVNTLRNVVLGQGSTRLCLVEHFLAAAAFCGAFDLDVVVDGPELPLGDGSAHFWLELFNQAGFTSYSDGPKYTLSESIFITKGDRQLVALPATNFSITYLMDWQHPSIGKRWCTWTYAQSPLEIARARTFGWQKDHDLLGLTDEVVSLTDDGFSKPLYFEDEPVRHKLLDLFGDLTLSGVNPLSIQGQFISIRGGHEMDVELAKQLKNKLKPILVLFLFVLLSYMPISARCENVGADAVSESDIDGASIIIYNQNRALIRQKRSFKLNKGINDIDWQAVPSTIDLSSIDLRPVNDSESISVKEQSYKNNLLSPTSILTRSIGKTVYLRHFLESGQSEEKPGILLSAGEGTKSGVVIKMGDHFIINPKDQIETHDLPDGLVTQPELSFKIQTAKSGEQDLGLTYQASNVNWNCNYLLVLNDAQDKFDLSAMATLENTCGRNFKNSGLKLLAGNVNSPMPHPYMKRGFGAVMATASAAPQFTENAFADYHLYTYDGTVGINNNETKRLTLIEGHAIPVVKKYVVDDQFIGFVPPKQKLAVQVKLEFQNDKPSNLGKPMPAGQVKVYSYDSQRELEFLGEDSIEHTPVGEKVKIKLGEAFDVAAEKTHVSSAQIAEHKRLDKFTISFDNHLDHDITVSAIEHMPYEFPVVTSGNPFTKVNSNTIQFDVNVPASGTASVSYQVEAKI